MDVKSGSKDMLDIFGKKGVEDTVPRIAAYERSSRLYCLLQSSLKKVSLILARRRPFGMLTWIKGREYQIQFDSIEQQVSIEVVKSRRTAGSLFRSMRLT